MPHLEPDFTDPRRFEVISSTLDEMLFHSIEPGRLPLTAEGKADFIAFLRTLTDEGILTAVEF